MGIDTGLCTWVEHRPVATDAPDGWCMSLVSIKKLLSLEREAGIEPASLAWKAKVLPLNYSRTGRAVVVL